MSNNLEQLQYENNFIHPEAMPYRAWSIMVTYDTDIFTKVVERAVKEAKRYGINRIEFHDFLYNFPTPEGFVDNVVRFENFPELKGMDTWHYERRASDPLDAKRVVTNEMLDKNVEHFRACAKMVKDAGLKLNVWCHSFREIPEEFYEVYGDRLSPDNEFSYEAFGKILDEFFSKIPEVDGLTLTSLGETKSFNDMPAVLPIEERMYKFFKTAHDVCSNHKRDLIIRDFGGGTEFWNVAKRLPEDIIYMTKWMPSDWERVTLPMSDRLMHAKEHKFVVEWDLRGEYLGQGFYPFANPRLYWQTLLNVKLFQPYGCVGRIHWTDWMGKQYEWDTVFDVPNGLNVYIYSKGLSQTSRFRDVNYVPGLQGEHLPYNWIREWIEENYGKAAWPELYEVFHETSGLAERLSVCADRQHNNHSFISASVHPSSFENVRAMLREAGREYIASSKASAAQRAVELAEKVDKIDIQPVEKKNKLIRSFKIANVFARLHSLWINFYADVIEWMDAGAQEPERMVEKLYDTFKKTQEITCELGGGIAKMVEERIKRLLPQYEEYILSGGQIKQKLW